MTLQNILGFANGLKSIRSVLLNLVELGPWTRQIEPISGYISTHQLHAPHFHSYDADNKVNEKIMKLNKIFREKGQSDPQGNGVM